MRICLVYDCLYPWTIGGAERVYRALAEHLAADGHEVTYLTLRQWEHETGPAIPGVKVISVGRAHRLYDDSGRRRVWPPIAFGAGVARHLARHGAHYDVVRTVSFPYFSVLAGAAGRRPAGFALEVDWFEVWSRHYWATYIGGPAGLVGWLVQRAAIRTGHRAFSWSQMHADRLSAEGHRGRVTVLRGALVDAPVQTEPAAASDRLLFAGRLVPEKNPMALVAAMPQIVADAPELHLDVFGDGPERRRLEELAARLGVSARITFHGFAPRGELDAHLAEALCVCVPSRREGYGLVIAEAAARGVPAVVCRFPDNAATELIEEGVNGFVTESDAPAQISDAVLRVRSAGSALRRSTFTWYARSRASLALEASLEHVSGGYGRPERP